MKIDTSSREKSLAAILFDVDGTLIDSNAAHAAAWAEVFRHYGKEIDEAVLRTQMGKGGDQLLPMFLTPEEMHRDGAEMAELQGRIFRSKYFPELQPFPKVRELVELFRANGLRVALASSSANKDLEKMIRLANIGDLIDDAVSRDDCEQSKPAPDVFAAALRKLGELAPARAIAIGDSPFDILAAARVKVRTLGFLCGGFAEATLREAGCIAIYDDPEDLLDRYDSSPFGG